MTRIFRAVMILLYPLWASVNERINWRFVCVNHR